MIRPHDKAGAAKGHAGRVNWKSGDEFDNGCALLRAAKPAGAGHFGLFSLVPELTQDLNLASLYKWRKAADVGWKSGYCVEHERKDRQGEPETKTSGGRRNQPMAGGPRAAK